MAFWDIVGKKKSRDAHLYRGSVFRSLKHNVVVTKAEFARTVWNNVDHGAGSVAAQSSVSGLLYEVFAKRRF